MTKTEQRKATNRRSAKAYRDRKRAIKLAITKALAGPGTKET